MRRIRFEDLDRKGSDYIERVTLKGVRLGDYKPTGKNEPKGPTRYLLKLKLSEEADGATVSVVVDKGYYSIEVELESCLDPDTLPPALVESQAAIKCHPNEIISAIAVSSAKLVISRQRDDSVRFKLTIGKDYASTAVVDIERLEPLLALEPRVKKEGKGSAVKGEPAATAA